jgi:uncharacterized membrane protein YfcA
MDKIFLFVLIGFAGQAIDGALGMAYGVTCSTALIALGIAPAVASASVHTAEIFTTAASGFSHWRLGNVDMRLVARLAVPGMIGGALGAYFLTSFPGETLVPYVSAYLLILGAVIVWRAFRSRPARHDISTPRAIGLGLTGGFLDAAGGGGWGPIVTSSLIGSGAAPRMAIGSVNLAEFFVAATITATFIATIGLELWPIIAGLIIGGVLAAPLAAYAASRIPAKPLMVIVGCLVILISARNIFKFIGG